MFIDMFTYIALMYMYMIAPSAPKIVVHILVSTKYVSPLISLFASFRTDHKNRFKIKSIYSIFIDWPRSRSSSYELCGQSGGFSADFSRPQQKVEIRRKISANSCHVIID